MVKIASIKKSKLDYSSEQCDRYDVEIILDCGCRKVYLGAFIQEHTIDERHNEIHLKLKANMSQFKKEENCGD